jgi:hypothetical protein
MHDCEILIDEGAAIGGKAMIDDAADRQRHDEGGDRGDGQSEEGQHDMRTIAAEERQEALERLEALAGGPGRAGIF